MESINNQVQSVRQLLAIPQLAIPSYQRPYRWGSKNISGSLYRFGNPSGQERLPAGLGGVSSAHR